MNDIALFIFGSVIFCSYMFFLLRMINNQHKAQAKNDPSIIDIKEGKKIKENKAS